MKTMSSSKAILFVLTSTVMACGSEADVARDVANEEVGTDAPALVIVDEKIDEADPSLLDVQFYKNLGKGRCMRDSTSSRGLHSGPCEGAAHKWQPVTTGRGILLKNVLTGDCIDDSRSHGLRAIGCHGGENQRWGVYRFTDDSIRFRNVATNDCIEERGGDLVGDTCSSGHLQRWK